MPFLYDAALDAALNLIKTDGVRIDICSQEPATYAEATSTYTLGNKTSVALAGPSDASPNGRKLDTPAFTDGSVTGNGTATHWSITDGTDTLVATDALSNPQTVYSGNDFGLASMEIKFPDAT